MKSFALVVLIVVSMASPLLLVALVVGCNESKPSSLADTNAASPEAAQTASDDPPSQRYWEGLNAAKVLAFGTDVTALSQARSSIAGLDITGVDQDLVKHGNAVAVLFGRIENYAGVSEPFPETPERSNPNEQIPSLKSVQDSITRKFKVENEFYFAPFNDEIERLNAAATDLRSQLTQDNSSDPGPAAQIAFDYRKHHSYVGTETAPGDSPPFLPKN